jgi:hypothetical protein
MVGMQGRITPEMGFTLSTEPTSIAPVLPVLAKASSSPAFMSMRTPGLILLGLGQQGLGGVIASW